VILHGVNGTTWQGISVQPGSPVFKISPPPYVTPEIVEFVRGNLAEVTTVG